MKNSKQAHERALKLGAWRFRQPHGSDGVERPAIKGFDDSLIDLGDRWHAKGGVAPRGIGNISICDIDFVPIEGAEASPKGNGQRPTA